MARIKTSKKRRPNIKIVKRINYDDIFRRNMGIYRCKESGIREKADALTKLQDIPTEILQRLLNEEANDTIIISDDESDDNTSVDKQIQNEINKIEKSQYKKRKQTYNIKDASVRLLKIPPNDIQREYNLYRAKRVNKMKNQTIRKVQQCVSKTLKKKQCKKRTAHTQKCWIHLSKEDNLRIKPSNIPKAGKGLFAHKNAFKSGDIISPYTGHKSTSKQINRKYGHGLAEYTLCDGDDCIDANWSTDAAARYANDSRGTQFINNAHYDTHRKKFILEANRYIKPGNEIFANYGSGYWLNK